MITGIQNAKNKPAQVKPDALTAAEISNINAHTAFDPASPSAMPQQEKGTKPACALPYQLFAEVHLDPLKKTILIDLGSGKGNFGQKLVPVGAPFLMHSRANYQQKSGKTWNYAVLAGDQISDHLKISDFEKDSYHLCINGPNGFFRQFKGNPQDPALKTSCGYEVAGMLTKKGTGNIQLLLENEGSTALKVKIKDLSYQKNKTQEISLSPKGKAKVIVDLQKSKSWYDFSIEVAGHNGFLKQYAGHVETGEESITDPYMGGIV